MENKIKNMRLHKKITQKELADLIGKTQRDISRWETGKVTPNGENLVKIAKALACKLDDLV